MQLCDPWVSGDGAEASVWDDLREGCLPRNIDRLAARSRSAKQVACTVRDVHPGEKGP
jgi:hypothetical protein